MLEHIAGRPNVVWKRNQVVLVLLFWIWRVVKGASGGPRFFYIPRINRFLTRFSPWQIIVATLSTVYAFRNADSLLGLGSPEPLANLYSPDFFRATWLTTALDAGFATAMPIQPKFLRDIFSMLFFFYYLVYARDADEKLRRYRAICTVEMLRTTWNKTTNPYIRALTYIDRPSVTLVRRFTLDRPAGSAYTKPISCMLFYAHSTRELAWCSELIYDIPGGGFVSMSPDHHEERLRLWTKRTGRPVLALDYGKAPEYPFPWALNEAFDVYRILTESNGKAIGMLSGRPINIVISGDSAGANIAVALTTKIIERSQSTSTQLSSSRGTATTVRLQPNPSIPPLPYPTALVLSYPALDFNFTSWMTKQNLDVLRSEHRAQSTLAASAHDAPPTRTSSTSSPSAGASLKEDERVGRRERKKAHSRKSSTVNLRALNRMAEQKDHMGHKSPLATFRDVKTRTTVASTSTSDTINPTPIPTAEDDRGNSGEVVMGVKRKRTWSQSLTGAVKSLAAPLSPVISSSSHKTSSSSENSSSTANSGSTSTTKVSASTPSRPSSGPRAASFRTRLRDHVSSELGSLEVNTSDLTPTSAPPPNVFRFPPPTRSLSSHPSSEGASANATPGGVDADDEDDDGDLDDIPEAERIYYRLAEKDKPLSARVLYGSEAEPEMGEFSAPPSNSASQFGLGLGSSSASGAAVPLQGSPAPMSNSVSVSFSPDLPTPGEPERHQAEFAWEVVNMGSEERAAADAAAVAGGAKKKVPIGTRLTMTSRAGFFQDRVVSPSMMRAMAILYVGPKRNPDFTTDYYISPILTPAHVLVDFPPVLMISGEKDPFVDDTVIFGGRLREAKRAKRKELLASSNSAPRSPTVGPKSTLGLKGEDARRVREDSLRYEEEEDWVEMRIIEGWGHGFLQMTSRLMLGKKAVGVVDDMADWIGDAFSIAGSSLAPASPVLPQAVNGVASSKSAAPPTKRRASPPRSSLAPTASDVPPPRHRPHSGSGSRSSAGTPTPTPQGYTGFSTSTKSKLSTSELPPASSETETDTPLSFTVGKRHSPPNTSTNLANSAAPTRPSLGRTSSTGSSSTRSSYARSRAAEPSSAQAPPHRRRTTSRRRSHQRGDEDQRDAPEAGDDDDDDDDDDGATTVVAGNGSPTRSIVSPTTSISVPAKPLPTGRRASYGDGEENGPLTPVASPRLMPEIFSTNFFSGTTTNGSSTPKQPASAIPASLSLSSSSNGGADNNSSGTSTPLLSQGELMRRRRMDAVFGMGESEDPEALSVDEHDAMMSLPSTRAPSPVVTKRGLRRADPSSGANGGGGGRTR
ncbi:alpha/beta-hydrolase [Clavulina sp. PMI_390]|nr:alpha/beta-hydrolase [Clavulina sp. PMI_390]